MSQIKYLAVVESALNLKAVSRMGALDCGSSCIKPENNTVLKYSYVDEK
jgi:hypothetical protein